MKENTARFNNELPELRKQLMIGNYLQDQKQRLCKVEELTTTDFKAPAINSPLTTLPNVEILLTEHWAERLGLKRSNTQDKFYSDNKGFIIEFINGQFEYVTTQRKTIIIKTVHKLQNLYFALNEKKLTLKKP